MSMFLFTFMSGENKPLSSDIVNFSITGSLIKQTLKLKYGIENNTNIKNWDAGN
jgi:hypothetical protein